MLFNIVFKYIIRESHIQTKNNIFVRNHQCLAYCADDVVILSQTEKYLIEVMKIIMVGRSKINKNKLKPGEMKKKSKIK